MKALVCDEPGRLSLVDRQRPVRAEGEILVRIRHVGICGTDFHIFAGKHPFLDYPRVMGHELSGTVEDVTLRVTRVRSANGEVVTVPNGQIVKVVNLSRDWARAVIDVPVANWAELEPGSGTLERFVTPRSLGVVKEKE